MVDRAVNLEALDQLELLTVLFVTMDGDLNRIVKWLQAAKLLQLAAKARKHHSELSARYLEIRKRVLEKTAVRALAEVVNDPRSKQRVAAANLLITMANTDSSTPDGRAALAELIAGSKGKSARAARK